MHESTSLGHILIEQTPHDRHHYPVHPSSKREGRGPEERHGGKEKRGA